LKYSLRHCSIAFSFAGLTSLAVGCTVETVGFVPPDPSRGDDTGTDAPVLVDAGTDAAQPSLKDAAPETGEPVPTTPFVTVTSDGVAMQVTNVTVEARLQTASDGTPYYEIVATLARTPPLLPFLDSDPKVSIRVTRNESGAGNCKEVRVPLGSGGQTSLTENREIEIAYRRVIPGSHSISTNPSTSNRGACTMVLKAPAGSNQAWGEATGTVQATGEPPISFQVKWFQPITWR
jgi:hypothetical protein